MALTFTNSNHPLLSSISASSDRSPSGWIRIDGGIPPGQCRTGGGWDIMFAHFDVSGGEMRLVLVLVPVGIREAEPQTN